MIDRTNQPDDSTNSMDRTQETSGRTGRRLLGWGIVVLLGAGFFFAAPALAFIGGSVILLLIAGLVLAGLTYLVYRLVR